MYLQKSVLCHATVHSRDRWLTYENFKSNINNNLVKDIAEPVHFTKPTPTGSDATIVLLKQLGDTFLNIGDELAVYNQQGNICGVMVYEGKNSAMIVVGDDIGHPARPTTELGHGGQHRRRRIAAGGARRPDPVALPRHQRRPPPHAAGDVDRLV